jgi:hypothetical protein
MLHRNCWTAGSISVGGPVVAFSQLFLVWSKIARNFHLQKPSTFSISKNLQHSPSPKTFNILHLQKPSTFSISKNLQHSPSPKTFNILHLQKPSAFSISKNLQHSPSPKTFNILRPFLCLDYTRKNAQVVTNLQQTCNNAVPAELKALT